MKTIPKHIVNVAVRAIETGKGLGAVQYHNIISDAINAVSIYAPKS